MQILSGEILKVEPDTRNCITERITSELSKCSGNHNECNYGLYAGKTSTYCLHPDHKKFIILSN
jgi:hypothetical protein